ncbi:MAG: 4'-phosphopantetheinyl transferase family protein [Vulcanimicrobiaceae bacterium]
MSLATPLRVPLGAPNPARPSSLAGELFAFGVAAAELREGGDASLLLEAERAECASAVPKRVAEFAAGRLCARRALSALGLEGVAVGRNADRSPAWPFGFTGSITHTLGFCAAAVARSSDCEALGIDAEIVGRVTPEVWPYVFTLAELALVDALPVRQGAALATLIFSAKEAFYKCQHALTGEWLEFGDVTLELAGPGETAGEFEVRPLRSLASPLLAGHALRGRFRFSGELVVTGIAIGAQR